jgi:ADP-heptose:LPS heptosyltransferase
MIMNVKVLRIIDKYLIWFFIILFFWLKYIFAWKKSNIIQKPKKILVIRVRALWSSLLTFPMIKQLEDYYWKWVQYDLLASTRNIWVYKNQWYFKNMYNLFSFKDVLKLICSFKKYDIVIDTEEYFMISALISLWLW